MAAKRAVNSPEDIGEFDLRALLAGTRQVSSASGRLTTPGCGQSTTRHRKVDLENLPES